MQTVRPMSVDFLESMAYLRGVRVSIHILANFNCIIDAGTVDMEDGITPLGFPKRKNNNVGDEARRGQSTE